MLPASGNGHSKNESDQNGLYIKKKKKKWLLIIVC